MIVAVWFGEYSFMNTEIQETSRRQKIMGVSCEGGYGPEGVVAPQMELNGTFLQAQRRTLADSDYTKGIFCTASDVQRFCLTLSSTNQLIQMSISVLSAVTYHSAALRSIYVRSGEYEIIVKRCVIFQNNKCTVIPRLTSDPANEFFG